MYYDKDNTERLIDSYIDVHDRFDGAHPIILDKIEGLLPEFANITENQIEYHQMLLDGIK